MSNTPHQFDTGKPLWRHSVLSNYLLFIASLFFVFHCLAVTSCLIPNDSVLYQLTSENYAEYLTATGVNQSWRMFASIPWEHGFEIQLVGKKRDGEEIQLGPLLPGLRKHTNRERVHKLYSAIQKESYRIYRDAYFRNIGDLLRMRYPDLYEYKIKFVSHRMWGVRKVVETGTISRPIESEYGPFSLD